METAIELGQSQEIIALFLKHGMWYFYSWQKDKNGKIKSQSDK
jgi:hypothetical protein